MKTECYLCNTGGGYHVIHHGVRDNPNIDVLKCDRCGLVWLSKFITDPDEYYRDSKMRAHDSEQNLKEIRTTAAFDDLRRYRFTQRMIENQTVLDFGCGAGGYLLEACKDAKAVYGVELEKAMSDAVNVEGIKCFPNVEQAVEELTGSVDVLTMFHVLEHLSDPVSIMRDLKKLLAPNGVIVIEVPNADDALLSLYGCDAFADFTYWESHLYLYNNVTFRMLMEKCGLRIRFLGQIQRYPLSNTLYWLAKGKPGGHKVWSMLSNSALDVQYETQVAKLGIADTIMAIVELE